ncbi:hypothetical protein CIPAW_08G176900 [Carya illinoinensis]|uniref:C2 domain-containing protein n=1 Tax=Carya illinoinensis TaxID=32201 RepID=A0A8T1PPR8_CARIL|nr:hypothetical protein CIPAW_08G176900 [Carya illinoinensis]
MGNYFLDVERAKQAVGGVQHSSTATNNNNAGHNNAVEFFNGSRGLQQCFTRVELSLSAINLQDRDIISIFKDICSHTLVMSWITIYCYVQSDPMAVVCAKNIDGKLGELGHTKVILNSSNPIWIEKVTVAFQFEIVQPFVFHVYDVDTKFHNIPMKVLTKQNRSLTLSLHTKIGHVGLRNLGVLTIHAKETVASRRVVEMMFHCSYLDNKDIFSKSDPFLRISRIVESGGSIPICKTEVVNNNLNPKWKPLWLSMQQFGSKDNLLITECFDFNSSGKLKLQKSMANLEKLHEGRSGANLTITSHHGHKKVLKGELCVDQFCEKEQYNFLDYISCGFELNFMVAVDFTDSLHYIDPSGKLNSYQKAIMEVGEVVKVYDSDRRFPAWGFSGKTFDGTISHCFNLNGSARSFEVEGVEGIMSAYASALHNVTLAGPTLFGQVIKTAAQIASQSVSYNSKKYFVLLIITDGVLTDVQEAKGALVKASDLPLSILIVGVGGADFGQMESSTDRVATRDIVQFVPMRDVHGGHISVVQALLEELPGQFLTYMRCRDIKPHPLHEAQASSS